MELTWPPGKYRRFEISQPFFCVHGVDVASWEVQKVQDITIACMEMTWPPRMFRKFEILQTFFCA
jgi:hypothetical protein